MLITVINNIIRVVISIAIVFVAPVMIAYAGFLLVVNQGDSAKLTEAKKILTNTIIGIVVALAGWLIVDAIMAVLYKPPSDSSWSTTWSEIITSGGKEPCLKQKGTSSATENVATVTAAPTVTAVPTVTTCSVSSLTSFTDPTEQVVWTNTDSQLKTCANKFINKVKADGNGSGKVTSAYRSKEYQTHLWEIRDRWCTNGLKSNSDSACSSLRSTVSAEVTKHFGSKWDCGAVGATSRHTTGTGVDIRLSKGNYSDENVINAAKASCLVWAKYDGDPYHYNLNLQSSCTCG